MKQKKGFALVMALILMVIFFAVTVAFTTIISYELKTARENQVTSKALYAADAGVKYAVSLLRSILKSSVEDQPMLWGRNEPGNPQGANNPGQKYRDSTIHTLASVIFAAPIPGSIDFDNNFSGRYTISMDPTNPPSPAPAVNPAIQRQVWPPTPPPAPSAGLPHNPPLYPHFNIYNLRLKVQGAVVHTINGTDDVMAAKTLIVEILINSRNAKCQLLRWYDAK